MSSLPFPKIVDRINNPDKIILTKGLLKDKINIRIDAMVKAAKEYSQWAAPVLLTVLLGYSIYTSHQQSNSIDQLSRDLTIIKTQKEDFEKYNEKEKQEILTKLGEAENWRKVLEHRIDEVKYGQQLIINKKEN